MQICMCLVMIKIVTFYALLSLIVLNHNFYILELIDLMENTEMSFAKLKLTPWCLIFHFLA